MRRVDAGGELQRGRRAQQRTAATAPSSADSVQATMRDGWSEMSRRARRTTPRSLKLRRPPAWLLRAMAVFTASVIESTIAFMEGMGFAIFYLGLRCSDAGELPLLFASAMWSVRADNVLEEKVSMDENDCPY